MSDKVGVLDSYHLSEVLKPSARRRGGLTIIAVFSFKNMAAEACCDWQ